MSKTLDKILARALDQQLSRLFIFPDVSLTGPNKTECIESGNHDP